MIENETIELKIIQEESGNDSRKEIKEKDKSKKRSDEERIDQDKVFRNEILEEGKKTEEKKDEGKKFNILRKEKNSKNSEIKIKEESLVDKNSNKKEENNCSNKGGKNNKKKKKRNQKTCKDSEEKDEENEHDKKSKDKNEENSDEDSESEDSQNKALIQIMKTLTNQNKSKKSKKHNKESDLINSMILTVSTLVKSQVKKKKKLKKVDKKKKIKKEKEESSEEETSESPERKIGKKKKKTKKKEESREEETPESPERKEDKSSEEETSESHDRKEKTKNSSISKKYKIKNKNKESIDFQRPQENEEDGEKEEKEEGKKFLKDSQIAPAPAITDKENKKEEKKKVDKKKTKEEDNKLLIAFKEANKKINKCNIFLNDFFDDIERGLKANNNKDIILFKKKINEFRKKYLPFIGIKRFAIPVIGCISSGKSTIINYLLSLKQLLEVKQKITTKCVCIIRHKKGNKMPKIYEVSIKERGKNIYNFEKKNEIKEKDVAKIICERNQQIKSKEYEGDYEKYFLIIEYEIPLFAGDFEEYGDLFEFMDIPGLNESNKNELFTKDKNNEKNLEKDEKKNSLDNNFYFSKIFPLINMNIKFSMFIFDALGYEKGDAIEIIRSYIGRHEFKGGEINEGKNRQIKEYDLKLEESIKEEHRFASVQSFENSLFILNKIDTVDIEEKEETNQHFINYIENKAKEIVKNNNPGVKMKINKIVNNKCKGLKYQYNNSYNYINTKESEPQPSKNIKLSNSELNINFKLKENVNELPICGEQLDKENTKFDSFEKYIDYYMNYSGDINENSFYEYIINVMNKEFEFEPKLKVKKNNIKEIKFPKDMKEQDKNNFKEFKESFANKNNNDFISPKNYMKLKKKFIEIKFNHTKKKESIFLSILKDKMRFTIEKYLNLNDYYFLYDEQANNYFCQKFNIDKEDNKNKKLERAMKKALDNLKNFGAIEESINSFEEKIKGIYDIDPNNDEMAEIMRKIGNYKDYFLNSTSIRYLVVGPYSSGKSSVINNIIGYRFKNLLPSKGSECTKIGVIIKYTDNIKNIKMYKANLITNEDGYNYFKIDESEFYEENEIYNKLDQLNNDKDAKSKKDFPYYLIQVPIEFLDDMEGLTREEKKKIEIIDFPGLDTDQFESAKANAEYLLKIIDGFIHIDSQDTFDATDGENSKKQILSLIYETIKERWEKGNGIFDFGTCLFILNKIDLLERGNTKIDINNNIEQIKKYFNILIGQIPNSQDALSLKKNINLNNISMVKFSSYLYKIYKEFETKLNNFEQFILSIIEKAKKNQEGMVNKVMNFLGNEGSIIKTLKKEIKFDESQYYKMKIDKYLFNTYLQRLKNLNIINGKEEELEEIVKIYLFIIKNKKKSLSYINSHAESFKEQFQKCISNSLIFFNKKQLQEFSSIITNSFYDIDRFYRIVKERMKNPDNSKIKDINIFKIENDIRQKELTTLHKFENIIDEKKSYIERRIRNYSNCSESEFRYLVNSNNDELWYLFNNMQSIKYEFDSFLKMHKNEVDKICKLEEFEKDKKEIQKKMKKFQNLSKGNDISASVNIATDSHRFLFWKWSTFNSSRSLNYYRDDIDAYFRKCKSDNIRCIRVDANNCISDIKKILHLFTTGIKNFEENKDLFDERIEDIKNFSQELFGIKI